MTGDNGASAPRLRTLGGQPAPPELVAGWHQIEKMPAKALTAFPELVVGALTSREAGFVNERVKAFCEAHALQAPVLAPLLDLAMQMVSQGCATNLTRELFEIDLAAISQGEGAPARILGEAFEHAKPLLRRQMMESTLVAHGKMLTGLEWRMDSVLASDRGLELGIPVVNLTLRYRERESDGHITLQAVPEVLSQLRQACQQLEAMMQQALQQSQGNAPH